MSTDQVGARWAEAAELWLDLDERLAEGWGGRVLIRYQDRRRAPFSTVMDADGAVWTGNEAGWRPWNYLPSGSTAALDLALASSRFRCCTVIVEAKAPFLSRDGIRVVVRARGLQGKPPRIRLDGWQHDNACRWLTAEELLHPRMVPSHTLDPLDRRRLPDGTRRVDAQGLLLLYREVFREST